VSNKTGRIDWAALGLPEPDHEWLMEETSGDLATGIGGDLSTLTNASSSAWVNSEPTSIADIALEIEKIRQMLPPVPNPNAFDPYTRLVLTNLWCDLCGLPCVRAMSVRPSLVLAKTILTAAKQSVFGMWRPRLNQIAVADHGEHNAHAPSTLVHEMAHALVIEHPYRAYHRDDHGTDWERQFVRVMFELCGAHIGALATQYQLYARERGYRMRRQAALDAACHYSLWQHGKIVSLV
jgi:hypothetical protein